MHWRLAMTGGSNIFNVSSNQPDEPNIIQQIGEIIRTLRDQCDIAIVLIEQFFALGDQFKVMKQGEVSFENCTEGLGRQT